MNGYLCLPLLPSIYEHSQHCISDQANHDSTTKYLLLKHGNETWSLIQYVLLSDLLNESLFCNQPFSKPKKFIESNKFAKIGLSTTKGGGFNPDFCVAPRIFSITHAFRAKPRQDMTALKDAGF